MKIGSLFFAIFALAATGFTTAEGYIGNTEEELLKWYGEPSVTTELYPMEGAASRLYHFNRLDILVNIVDGHSWSEFYRKSDGSEITTKEINTIVLANTGREPTAFTPTGGILNSTAGDVAITYDPIHRALYLASLKHSEKMDSGMTLLVSVGRRHYHKRSLTKTTLDGRKKFDESALL